MNIFSSFEFRRNKYLTLKIFEIQELFMIDAFSNMIEAFLKLKTVQVFMTFTFLLFDCELGLLFKLEKIKIELKQILRFPENTIRTYISDNHFVLLHRITLQLTRSFIYHNMQTRVSLSPAKRMKKYSIQIVQK